MNCVLCKNTLKEYKVGKSIIVYSAGRIQKLNDNSLMIICGYGSDFDENGYSPNSKNIQNILINNIEK